MLMPLPNRWSLASARPWQAVLLPFWGVLLLAGLWLARPAYAADVGGIRIVVTSGSGGAAVQVTIEPPAAYDAGARWRVVGAPVWSEGQPYVDFIACGTSVMLEFKAIPGWNLPPYQEVIVPCGSFANLTATYTPIPPGLAVSPPDGLAATGYVGGPFTPAAKTYNLSNSGWESLNWSASVTTNWLTLSATNGVLAGGTSTNVTVSVNPNANGLGAGCCTNTLSFTNLTSGRGNTTRQVVLNVVHPPVRLLDPRVLSGGRIAMTLEGITNAVYAILNSSDLLTWMTNWTEVLRLTNTTGQTAFTNPPSAFSPFYYRAKEL